MTHSLEEHRPTRMQKMMHPHPSLMLECIEDRATS